MRLLVVVGIVALIWLVGLFAFAHRVRELTPAEDPAPADAIVALTGPRPNGSTPPSACWSRARVSAC